MATDLGRTRATTPAKYDAFVAGQLARAESRIRLLDLAAGLLGLLAGTLVYAALMALLDRQFELSAGTRQFAFLAYLAGAGVYLWVFVRPPLRRRVNPYYAARQVEQTLPGAKNSVVNWIDLHGENLPPSVRGALGQRAAKDLARADLDRAISGRRTGWFGAAAGLCAVIVLALFFAFGPGPFFYRLGRAFSPFSGFGPAPTRTRLTLLRPEPGDATVTVGRAVTVAVEVGGKVPDPKGPDAVRLLYRYQESDPYLERPLQHESNREWSVTVPAIDVQNGFWYKVAGGDAETPEYRVRVRSTPAVVSFRATYKYRDYAGRPEEVRRERDLEALRGTEVTLLASTNRSLREARVELEGKESSTTVPGEGVPGDPQSARFQFVLEESGQYRIHFTAADGERYTDPERYRVTAVPDRPPTVALTKPGQDIRLPANGVLQMEGRADDDVGVKGVVLRARVLGGDRLSPKPYRPDDKMRLPAGGYPLHVDYKDFLDLAQIRVDLAGKQSPLAAGMELEYWLEVRDACDYPRAEVESHTVESKRFRVKIVDPEADQQKQQEQRRQAEQEQQRHEQKQEQQRQKENQQREQARQEQQKRNQEEQAKGQQERQKAGGQGQAGKGGDQQQDPKANPQNSSANDPNKQEGGAGDNAKSGSEGNKGPSKGEKEPGAEKTGKGGAGEQASKQREELNKKVDDLLKRAEKEQGAGGKNNKGGTEQSPEGGKPDARDGGEKNRGSQGGNNQANGERSEGSKGDGSRDKPSTSSEGSKGQKGAGGQPRKGSDSEPRKTNGEPGRKPEAGAGGKEGSRHNAAKPGPKPDKPEANRGGEPAGGRKPGEKGEKENMPGEGAGRGQAPARGPEKPDNKQGAGAGQPKKGPKSPEKQPGAGGEGGQPKSEDAKPGDVKDLARKAQTSDPKTRKEVADQLEKIQDQARDPQARKDAREALERLRRALRESQKDPKQTTEPKAGPDGPRKGEDSTQTGSGDGQGEKENGKTKVRESGGEGSGEKNKGETGDKENGVKNGGEGRGKDGNAKQTEGDKRNKGRGPGGGGPNRKGRQDDPDSGKTDPARPEKPAPHRATQLQLERIDKLLKDRKVKDPKLTEELKKAYAELQKMRQEELRNQKTGPAKETNVKGSSATPLPSVGGSRRTGPAPAEAPGDVSGSRALPPPGYRDAYRKLTRERARDR